MARDLPTFVAATRQSAGFGSNHPRSGELRLRQLVAEFNQTEYLAMPDTEVVQNKNRPAYSWWVIPTALFLMVLMSALGPHLLRKRIIGRLEALGAKIERANLERWWIPIDQIPGLRNLSKLPVWMQIDAGSSPAQCTEIFRIAPRLSSFRELELSDSATVDEHLKALGSWADLQKLSLTNTHITDRGLHFVGRAAKLSFLNLSHCEIGDAACTEIAKLQRLEHLELTGTKITDAGLKQLQSLKNLRVLGLSNTQVSEAAIEDLVKKLPDLHVTDD
jgi:hypothetical protein